MKKSYKKTSNLLTGQTEQSLEDQVHFHFYWESISFKEKLIFRKRLKVGKQK